MKKILSIIARILGFIIFTLAGTVCFLGVAFNYHSIDSYPWGFGMVACFVAAVICTVYNESPAKKHGQNV